jgi:hypothetical protein
MYAGPHLTLLLCLTQPKLHTSDPAKEPAFTGTRFHNLDAQNERSPQREVQRLGFLARWSLFLFWQRSWVDIEREKREERRRKMLPNPVSSVRDDQVRAEVRFRRPCTHLRHQGKRPAMEDAHHLVDDCVSLFGQLPDNQAVSYWAVYDGHGGVEAALLVKELLLPRIIRHITERPGWCTVCLWVSMGLLSMD